MSNFNSCHAVVHDYNTYIVNVPNRPRQHENASSTTNPESIEPSGVVVINNNSSTINSSGAKQHQRHQQSTSWTSRKMDKLSEGRIS